MAINFEEYLTNNVHTLLCRDPFNFFAESFIPFKQLKIALSQIDPSLSGEQALIKGSGQCCICLQEFNRRSEMAFTKCSHAFHPACLAQYIEVGFASKKCPLCRSPKRDLYPTSQDGLIVNFLLTFWARVQKVEKSHVSFIKLVQSQLRSLQKNESSKSLLYNLLGSRQNGALRHDAEVLMQKLVGAAFIAEVNRAGFLELLDELEERCSEGALATAYRERLLACRFVHDNAAHGRLDEIRAQVVALLPTPPAACSQQQLHAQPRGPSQGPFQSLRSTSRRLGHLISRLAHSFGPTSCDYSSRSVNRGQPRPPLPTA